jgi:hypothetical protein
MVAGLLAWQSAAPVTPNTIPAASNTVRLFIAASPFLSTL